MTSEQIKTAFGSGLLDVRGTRRSLTATLDRSCVDDALQPETGVFADQHTFLTFRNGETPEATLDWLDYHRQEHGLGAALIFDRSEPGTSDYADQLAALKPAMPVLVVTGDQPLGLANGPDTRHSDTAPVAPKRGTPPSNPWHAPLWEHGVLELLRHAYLAQASAVAFLSISDLLLPSPDNVSVFEKAIQAPGTFLTLKGVETYPWRLRKSQPAPHSDHVARRSHERRGLLSWCMSPGDMPDDAAWLPGKPHGVSVSDAPPLPFVRAVGVTYPGVEVNRLVKKSDLREEPALVQIMSRAFDVEPLRLPRNAAIPPRPSTPGITIVTAMKNEGPFVLDWIAHNRVIGVTNHLVYTNDCEDGTDHLLDCLADAGVLRRDNPYRATGKVPQYAAFRAAEGEPVVQKADWLLTIDVDEYVNIHAGNGRITDLLDVLPEAHLISMPWRMFGNADRHQFEDIPVTQAFRRCAPAFAPRPLQAWAFKTLYRNAGLFRRLGVHRPKGLNPGYQDSLSWVDAGGRPLHPAVWPRAWRMSKGQWGYEYVTLNHYAVRSAESFLIKRERGKVNRTKREQGLAYWFRMNHNAEEDRSIDRYASDVEMEKAALLALPGVADAHAKAVAWHKNRARQLRADAEYAALYDQITSPRMQHLSRIATNFGANVHLVGPQVIPDDIAAHPEGEPFYWTVKLARS